MHAILVNTLVGANNNDNNLSRFSDDADFISPELESDFFSNFTCCGETLPSLHDLVKHYEECHIRFEEDYVYNSSSSSTNGNNMTMNGGVISGGAGFLSSDDELRAFSVSPTLPDYGSPFSHHHHNGNGRSASAFSAANNSNGSASKKRKHVSLDFDEGSDNDGSAFNNTILRRGGYDSDISGSRHRLMNGASALSSRKVQQIRNFLGFYNENALTEAFDEEEHNSRIYSILTAASANSNTPNATQEYDSVTFPIVEDNADLDSNVDGSEDKEKVKKPYACSVPGCEKSYKNPNGLKYHMIHGHCIGSPSNSGAGGSNGSNSDQNKIIDRPYVCNVSGCGKRYKNRNGLSYHVSHAHPLVDPNSVIIGSPQSPI